MYKGKIADKKIKDPIYYFIFRYKYIGLNIRPSERLVSPDWFKGLVSHWNFHMQKTFFMCPLNRNSSTSPDRQNCRDKTCKYITAIDFTTVICEWEVKSSTFHLHTHWGAVKTYHLAAFLKTPAEDMSICKSLLFGNRKPHC